MKLRQDDIEKRLMAALEALNDLRGAELLSYLPLATEKQIENLEACLHVGLRQVEARREEFSSGSA